MQDKKRVKRSRCGPEPVFRCLTSVLPRVPDVAVMTGLPPYLVVDVSSRRL